MTTQDMDGQVLEQLGHLRPLTPDPARAARVRAQCLVRLAQHRRRSQQATRDGGLWPRVIASAVVVSLYALYLASVVGATLGPPGGF